MVESDCRSPASGRRNKARSEGKQLEPLKHHSADLIVLARYMQILSARFVAKIPAGDYQRASLVFTGLHRSKAVFMLAPAGNCRRQRRRSF
jgi:hypothetical protein